MRASFCIDGMPMKSLKVLLSFILRVLCSGMGGRAGQGARGMASATGSKRAQRIALAGATRFFPAFARGDCVVCEHKRRRTSACRTDRNFSLNRSLLGG